MKGRLFRRCRSRGAKRCTHPGDCRWGLIFDGGKVNGKRKQIIRSFRGNADQAESWRRKLLEGVKDGTFVAPHERMVEQWLREWLEKAIHGKAAKATYDRYKGIIERDLVPKLGSIRLQDLRSLDISNYYAGLKTSQSTAALHHTILTSALKAAMAESLVGRNAASTATGRPKGKRAMADVLDHCWSATEAQAFLTAAKTLEPQISALFALALDSGARRGEIGALQWSDVDWAKGTIRIARTLISRGAVPEYGLPKTKSGIRTIDLSAETIVLLRAHKVSQAELKMKIAPCMPITISCSRRNGAISMAAKTRSVRRSGGTTWAIGR